MVARLLEFATALGLVAVPVGADAQRGSRPEFRPVMPRQNFAPPRAAEARAAYDPIRRERRCARTSGGAVLGAIAGGLLGDPGAGRGAMAGAGALGGGSSDRGC